MQRKFLKNLVLLLVLNLLIKPFWILGIDRTVQNTVGASEYGFYFAILNFSFLFNILLDFGITNFNNKNIAQNNQLLKKHLSNILVLKLLLFFVYLLVTIGAALFINYSRQQINMLALLAFNQFLLSFIHYLRSNLGGLHMFRTDSIISVLDRSLMIILVGVLLWGNVVDEFKIHYYIYAQTAAYFITAGITFFIVLQKASPRFFRLSWNFPFLVMIIKQSFPFAILVLLMTFYNRIDSVMLERLLDKGAKFSGIYAQAFRLLEATNMIAYLFAVLLLPIFARMIKQKQSIEELAKLSFTLIITPAIIIAVGSNFYSGQIMELLYPIHAEESPQDFAFRIQESSRVFGLLMTCFSAVATTYIFGTLLTANGSLKLLNIISFSGMLVNIILNFILIPHFQTTGSAVASLFTQSLIAIIQVMMVRKVFGFRKNYLFLGRLLLYIAGTILINIFSLMLPFPWHINFLMMVTVSLLFAMLIGFLSVGNIIKVFRYGEM